MTSKKKQWFSFNFGDEILEPKQPPIKKKPTIKSINLNQKKLEEFQYFKQLEPKSVDDLAVHPKKIQEVDIWINDSVLKPITKQNVPMLLITGPTGSGKTATVRTLCKSLNIDIQEWISPSDQDWETFKGPSQGNKLLEFLHEATYPSLFSKSNNNNKVTLVEDFPNSLVNNLKEFDRILSTYVSNGKSIIIFICTDINTNGLNITKNLFPEEIRQKYNIHNISFNAASTTLLKQALKRAQGIVQSNIDILKLPGPNVIEAIIASAMGDIRCAVNQYYFASMKGTDDLPMELIQTEKLKPGQKRKRIDKSSKIKLMSKDEPLGLFHSLGRVLNPKRIEYKNSWRIQHDLDSLIDEFSTQPSTFNAFLYENYIKYFGDIDDLQKASDVLSLSQTFLEKWSDRHDTLIFALWISVLGLMVYNEHRVSKWNAIKGPVKIKAECNNVMENRNLLVTDYCFYNRIKKCDKYYTFVYNKK